MRQCDATGSSVGVGLVFIFPAGDRVANDAPQRCFRTAHHSTALLWPAKLQRVRRARADMCAKASQTRQHCGLGGQGRRVALLAFAAVAACACAAWCTGAVGGVASLQALHVREYTGAWSARPASSATRPRPLLAQTPAAALSTPVAPPPRSTPRTMPPPSPHPMILSMPPSPSPFPVRVCE
jgi:hypothetical protein